MIRFLIFRSCVVVSRASRTSGCQPHICQRYCCTFCGLCRDGTARADSAPRDQRGQEVQQVEVGADGCEHARHVRGVVSEFGEMCWSMERFERSMHLSPHFRRTICLWYGCAAPGPRRRGSRETGAALPRVCNLRPRSPDASDILSVCNTKTWRWLYDIVEAKLSFGYLR